MAPMMTSQLAQWDPVQVFKLDIADIGYSVHCHGKTLKGIRCANPVGRTWHDEIRTAHRLLASRPLNQISEHDLVPLASSLLCRHRHNGTQDHQLAARWFQVITVYTRKNAFIKEEDSVAGLKVRLAAAKAEAKANLNLCTESTTELLNTSMKLSAMETRKAEIERDNEVLRSKLSATVAQRDAALGELQQHIRSSVTTLTRIEEQHDKEISDIKQQNEESEQNIKTELAVGKTSLRTKSRELRDSKEKITSIERKEKLQAASLKENNKQSRMKEYLMMIRHQLQNRMWERHVEGLRADNQTLIEQQRHLQQVASGFGQELQALQVRKHSGFHRLRTLPWTWSD